MTSRNSSNKDKFRPSYNHTGNLPWADIDTVFLDMDGTLLDKYYDDYFWEQYVPQVYSRHHNLSEQEAKQQLLEIYQSVEGTLQWTDLDYWSHRLNLDIPQLKEETIHRVNIHPHALNFLKTLQKMKKGLYLVTNAHPTALQLKMERVKISHIFSRAICSQEVGFAKEQTEFWQQLQTILPYDKNTTLFADDTEKVLDSAARYGIAHLVHIAKPSTQLPAAYSNNYLSIDNFQPLLPPS